MQWLLLPYVSTFYCSFFSPCNFFQNHGKNCWEDVVCARCDWLTGQDWDLPMWKYYRGRTWIGVNWSPWSSVLGFEVLIFCNWGCNFCRLTWWFSKLIFSNAINTIWCDNIIGVVHELVDIGHLDYFCWVFKYWWVVLGRVGFGCWLGDCWKSIFFNIITSATVRRYYREIGRASHRWSTTVL